MNIKMKILYGMVCTILFGCSENTVKEYFNNGSLSNESFYNKEHEIFLIKSYYKTGELQLRCEMNGKIRNGSSKEYYKNGSIMVSAEFNMGQLLSYSEFDSTGATTYWFELLKKNQLPSFSNEFIKLKAKTDTGLIVQMSIPDISPYQVSPILISGYYHVIDVKSGLWYIKSVNDSVLRIGTKILLNDTSQTVLGWKEIKLSPSICTDM